MSDKSLQSAPNHHDSGSFVGGFTVGLFAGALGYFLFGTKRGGQVRSQLVSEWDKAKDQLVDQGVLESKDISLGELLKDFFGSVFNSVAQSMPSADSVSKSSSRGGKMAAKDKSRSTAATKAATRPKKRLFRNV